MPLLSPSIEALGLKFLGERGMIGEPGAATVDEGAKGDANDKRLVVAAVASDLILIGPEATL